MKGEPNTDREKLEKKAGREMVVIQIIKGKIGF